MSIQGDLKDAFETTIETLGTPATWRQTKAPGRSILMTVGARMVGRSDTEVVNAIGIGGRVLTARHRDFDGEIPAKFDTFDLGDGKVYTASSVHEVWWSGMLVGWKILAKARQP